MPSDGQFKSIQDGLSNALMDVTRSAGQIGNQDLTFLRSTNPAATKLLDEQNARLLGFAQRLCQSAAKGMKVRAPEFSSLDQVDENWQGLVDLVDNLLERADGCLDEYTGVIKKQAAAAEAAPVASDGARTNPPKGKSQAVLPKPQKLFQNRPKNDESTPFKPLLRSKPHAIVPLEESIRPDVSETAEGRQSVEYRHPYQVEIEQLQYAQSMFTTAEPVPYQPFESTTATFVDTPESVNQMLAELKGASEIAVDLEHHDTHSYIGIVCLMQISTRDKDWIIDTLKPWREDLQVLNEVFADPKILKVLHGAASDIIWLQRDLGLYVVGLFDTYHAACEMHYPQRSLKYLLEHFVNFNAQKQYQLADWRTRPLPKEMFEYARSDTHFLLYVYDRIRNELAERTNASQEDNLMDTVLRLCKETALQRYERPAYDTELGSGPGGWFNLLWRTPSLFSREQFAVFRAVHQWRDQIARKEDENPHEVLSRGSLFTVARDMPAQMTKLRGVLVKVSPMARSQLDDLLSVIRYAKANGAEGPDMEELIQKHPLTKDSERRQQERRQEKAETLHPGLAKVLERERKAANEREAAKSQGSLLAETSLFWGPSLPTRATPLDPEGSSKLNGGLDGPDEIRLHLPLPPLTEEVSSGTADTTAVVAAASEHAFVKPAPQALGSASEDDVIVLREQAVSRKRKAPHVDKSVINLDSSSDHASPRGVKVPRLSAVNGSSDTPKSDAFFASPEGQQLSKKARKAWRKRERETAAAEQQSGGYIADGVSAADEPAFDYANAPPVFNAVPQAPAATTANSGGKKGKRGRKGGQANPGGQGKQGQGKRDPPGFNPYGAKVLNAPKGPKGKGNKGPGGGKSATFGK